MSNIELYNADCGIQMKHIPSESIDLVLTDVPFGVNFKNDFYDDSLEHVLEEMPKWYSEWYRILKDNSYLYLFVGVKTIHKWIQAGIDAGFTYKNIIATSTYHSDKIPLNNNFNFQLQPILLFSKGKGKPFNKVDFIPTSESWLKDKRNKNPKPFTYDYPDFIKPEWCFSTIKRKKNERLHPNEKNHKLIKFFIELSTKENDVVLDTFMGSGSTGIACKEANRNFIGIELNKDMYNIAKERING